MDTKLTLKLNKRAIERAKKYAKKNKQSLSGIVENYFNMISNKEILDEIETVSYTHLRAHETVLDIVCRLLLEKTNTYTSNTII